jgi:antitoxin component of MazEF toxin-antitoxin module
MFHGSVTVGTWGKHLAIRFPRETSRTARISNGERLQIEVRAGEIAIRRAAPHFTLEDLFKGKTPKEWRALYSEAFEWGSDVGREQVEE